MARPGAVDHAADIAVERDIGEVVFRRLDLLLVLFGGVAQFQHVGVAEQRVVVERHLCVEHAQMAVLHDDQRIDLEQAHVLLDEGLVEDREQRIAVLGRVAVELQRAVERLQIGCRDALFRVDGDGDDLFRRVMRDRLDVHAALGRDDEGDAADRAIDQDRQIELALDVGAVLDVEPVDLLAGRAGLLGDQRVAEHLLGVGDHFGHRLRQPHAALGVGRRAP